MIRCFRRSSPKTTKKGLISRKIDSFILECMLKHYYKKAKKDSFCESLVVQNSVVHPPVKQMSSKDWYFGSEEWAARDGRLPWHVSIFKGMYRLLRIPRCWQFLRNAFETDFHHWNVKEERPPGWLTIAGFKRRRRSREDDDWAGLLRIGHFFRLSL